MATNTSTTTTNSLPPPSSPMFTETLINKICCSIINRLLGALHCFSPPVGDLHELDDGVVLVELIESFEEAIFVRYPQLINSNSPQNNSQKPFRNALSRTGSSSNMEYVEQWLMLEGVNLDPKRSIREIFAEIRRSSQELATFLGTFSEDDLTDNNSLGTMLQKQRVAIYARSIAYISALCYAIFTIFLKHDEQFKQLIPGFRFTVEPDELLHILFYTKWKLTEEELLIKDLEFMRLKDSADLLEIENRRLKGLKGGNDPDNRVPQPNSSNSEISFYQQQQQQQNNSSGQTSYPQQQMNSTSTSTAQNSPHFSLKNHSKQSSSELQPQHDFESVSSITISSVAELRSVSTQTDIFGLENQLHVQYGFNRKLMEMTVAKDREIAEKVAEQVKAAKAAAEEQRQADARWAAEQEEKRRRKNASQEEAQNLAQNTSNSSQHSFQNRTLPDHFCQPEMHSHSAIHTQVPTSAEHSGLPVTPDDPSHFPVHFSGQGQQQQQQQQQQQRNYQQQQQQQQNYQQKNLLNQNNRPVLPNYQQTRERNYHPQAVISPPLSPTDDNNVHNNDKSHHPHHHHQQNSNTSNANNNNNNSISSPMLSPQSSPSSSSSSVQLRHSEHPKQTPAKPERPSSLASSASSNSKTPNRHTSSNLNRNSSHVHSSIYSRGQFDVLEAQQNSLAGGNFSLQNSTKNSSTFSNEDIQRTPIDFEYNKQQVELSLTGKGGKGSIKGGRQRESPSPRPSQPPPPVPLSAVPTEDQHHHQRDYPDGNDNSQTAKNAKIAQDIITTLNNNNNNSNEDQSQRTAQHQYHHQLPSSIDGSGDNDGDGNGNSNDNAGDGDPQTASEKFRQLELIREHHKQNSGRAGYTDDEQLRNRILIARLLAELSYEKNKNLRQTTQDYI